MRTYDSSDLSSLAYEVGKRVARAIDVFAEKHSLDKVFFHTARVRFWTPPYHRAPTTELGYPFRRSNSHVIALLGRGIVVGKWQPGQHDEYEAVASGLLLREPTTDELESFTDDHTHGPGVNGPGVFRPGKKLRGQTVPGSVNGAGDLRSSGAAE